MRPAPARSRSARTWAPRWPTWSAGRRPAGAPAPATCTRFAVRPSEVRLPQGGAFLLGVELTAGDANALAPALPQIDGGVRIARAAAAGAPSRCTASTPTACRRCVWPAAGAGAYTLRLFAVGDLNADQRVDGVDAGLLAARAAAAGDVGFCRAADLDARRPHRRRRQPAAVRQPGLRTECRARGRHWPGFTHVELDTALAVAGVPHRPGGRCADLPHRRRRRTAPRACPATAAQRAVQPRGRLLRQRQLHRRGRRRLHAVGAARRCGDGQRRAAAAHRLRRAPARDRAGQRLAAAADRRLRRPDGCQPERQLTSRCPPATPR